MKRHLYVTLCITLITAVVSAILWLDGFPPEKEGLSETALQIRGIVTLPLFWAGFGLLLSSALIWFKREKLAEFAGKASRIPAMAVQIPAVLALLIQIMLALKLYGIVDAGGSRIIFFYFLSAIFLVMGNYIATAPFGSMIGFRTAATLSDEKVWTRTHRFLGRNLVLMSIVTLPLPWLVHAEAAQWVLIGFVACLKLASWLFARRLAAQLKLRGALPN